MGFHSRTRNIFSISSVYLTSIYLILITLDIKAWNCLSDELREPLLTANSFRQLQLVCLLSTSAYSALEVLHITRYINLYIYIDLYSILTY